MVIDVKVINDSIEVKCKPIVPAQFKYRLLENLQSLYTLKTDDNIDFQLVANLKIEEERKKEFLECYEHNEFNYSFEEFLELSMFPVGTVELLSKKKEEKIAFIDFVPDGDVDLIWIDVYDREHQQKLINLIKKII